MKLNKLIISGVVFGLAGISGTAMAQVNEITQPVTAEIIAPAEINLTQAVDMTFEATIASAEEQTVAAAAAAFTVEGADRNFTVDTSGSSTELVLPESAPAAGDGSSMPFTVTASTAGDVITEGTAEFTVDGSITVAADQAAGIYEGNLVVTVAYE